MGVVEFYITNVCNLTCQGCNRFNNYKFSGFQKWTDLESVYTKWAEQLRLTGIGILGGEPLLNPEYMLWLQGLRTLWPNSTITTTTNGYRLNQVKGLYDYMLAHKTNTFLSVGIHNKKSKSLIMDNIEKFLTGPIHYEFDSENQYRVHMILTDANGVQLKVEHNWWFHQGAIIKQDNTLTLHQSDVTKAHDICHMKTCHHFIRGELYKCGVVAVLPEFDQQHLLTLSTADRELMLSYRPLNITDSDVVKQQFVNNLTQPIDQCRFCPEQYNGDQIFALQKNDRK